MQLLFILQKQNKMVLLECVKQIIQNPAAANQSKILILQMLIERTNEFPTLSLEVWRRLLLSYFNQQQGVSDIDNLDLKLQIINLGCCIYSNKEKAINNNQLYTNEHRQIISELFEYMLQVGESGDAHNSILVRSKVAIIRALLEREIDFNQYFADSSAGMDLDAQKETSPVQEALYQYIVPSGAPFTKEGDLLASCKTIRLQHLQQQHQASISSQNKTTNQKI